MDIHIKLLFNLMVWNMLYYGMVLQYCGMHCVARGIALLVVLC